MRAGKKHGKQLHDTSGWQKVLLSCTCWNSPHWVFVQQSWKKCSPVYLCRENVFDGHSFSQPQQLYPVIKASDSASLSNRRNHCFCPCVVSLPCSVAAWVELRQRGCTLAHETACYSCWVPTCLILWSCLINVLLRLISFTHTSTYCTSTAFSLGKNKVSTFQRVIL